MLLRRALTYLPMLVVLSVEALVLWPMPLHVGDWFQYWYVGRIVATGGSPLDAAAWRDIVYGYPTIVHDFVVNVFPAELGATPETPLSPPWLYPPWTAALFVPFGILPLEAGIVLLHITLLVTGVGAVLWLVSRLDLPTPARALALALAVALQPFVLATRTGHFSALLLIGALLVLVALERRRTASLPFVAGAVILTLKPHVAALFGVVVLVALIRRRAWRQIAITSTVLLTIATVFYLRYPPPVGPATQAILARATTDDSATTWALAEQVVPGAGLAVGAVAVLVAAAVAWSAVRAAPSRLQTLAFVAMALSLSLAVSPYVHTYDQLLLAPALLLPFAITAPLPGPHRLAMGTATLVGALVYPWLAYFADIHARQAPTAAVPFIAVALVSASALLAARHERVRVSALAPAASSPARG